MDIRKHVRRVQQRITAAARNVGRDSSEITLCAATKMQTHENIRAAISAGVKVCGENRMQELVTNLSTDTYKGTEQIHFIGHLQTNKVKQVVGQVDLIQSVDSVRLLRAIDEQAGKIGCVQDILLEVNIAQEVTKSGCCPEQLEEFARLAADLPNVSLRGLMAIPPACNVLGGNRGYFRTMHQLFVDIQEKISDNQNRIDCLSMGMSGDFEEAVEEGATLVRLGSAIFGPRHPMTEMIELKQQLDQMKRYYP